MDIFKNALLFLVFISACSSLNAHVSLTGPFSAESKKLVQYAHNPFEKIAPEFQKYADGIAFLRAINVKLRFSVNFDEFNAPKNMKMLTAPENTPVIEALVQLITARKPEMAKVHFNPYGDLEEQEAKFILAKIALMTNDVKLFDEIIKESSPAFLKQLFLMVLYEADLNNVAVAENFLSKLQSPDANSEDALGFTLLAIAAVTKGSPELTRFILKLNPDVNFGMESLYHIKNPYQPKQEKLFAARTVFNLIDEAIKDEEKQIAIKNPNVKAKIETPRLKNLMLIKTILVDAGAKKSEAYRVWDLD